MNFNFHDTAFGAQTSNPPFLTAHAFPTFQQPGFHANPPLPLAPAPPPPTDQGLDPAVPPLTIRQQYALNHRLVLGTLRGRRIHSVDSNSLLQSIPHPHSFLSFFHV
jgi:hypothetical protein